MNKQLRENSFYPKGEEDVASASSISIYCNSQPYQMFISFSLIWEK